MHLFVLHPSPALWQASPTSSDGGPPITSRRDDRTADAAGQPAARLLGPRRARAAARARGARGESVDHHHALPRPKPRTLLAAHPGATSATTASRPAPAAGRARRSPALDADDRSVQIHACHGRARQVEVLRDAVLHLLEDDPTLEPRDVIVMCPDIETFAPLIQATFGAGRHGRRR